MEPATTLLIDDQPYLADSLVDAFSDEGLSLDVASSWSEGMGRFVAVAYELVIADYDLGESHTGLRLLAEVKMLAPSTRLVLVTGRLDTKAEPLVATSFACDLYLAKTDANLRATLIAEAMAARERAKVSDWASLGQAHLRAADVDLDNIATLEEELRRSLGGRE